MGQGNLLRLKSLCLQILMGEKSGALWNYSNCNISNVQQAGRCHNVRKIQWYETFFAIFSVSNVVHFSLWLCRHLYNPNEKREYESYFKFQVKKKWTGDGERMEKNTPMISYCGGRERRLKDGKRKESMAGRKTNWNQIRGRYFPQYLTCTSREMCTCVMGQGPIVFRGPFMSFI